MQTQPAIPTLGTWGTRHSDPIADEQVARQSIADAGWFPTSGIECRWPVTTGELAQILSMAAQYEIDEAGILDLLQRRIVPKPAFDDDGNLEWNAFDALQVAIALEGRRQWAFPSSIHDVKRHPCDKIVAESRERGDLETILHSPPPVPKYDVQSLFILLLSCDNREGREKVGALLKACLECEHGVMII